MAIRTPSVPLRSSSSISSFAAVCALAWMKRSPMVPLQPTKLVVAPTARVVLLRWPLVGNPDLRSVGPLQRRAWDRRAVADGVVKQLLAIEDRDERYLSQDFVHGVQ